MEVINLLWQLGILSAVLIFGIKLGLATGLANMSKRYLAIVSIGYGGGVLILTEISSFFFSFLFGGGTGSYPDPPHG